MMFSNNAVPRRFSLRPVYSDERKERLRAIEERARRQLNMPAEAPKNRAVTPSATGEDVRTAENASRLHATNEQEGGYGRLRGAFRRHDHRPRPTSWRSSGPVVWLLATILAAVTFLMANTASGREMLFILTT